MRRIFISGRFERREEFKRYRSELEQSGIEVTSRWLTNPAPEAFTDDVWRGLAIIDREDIERAEGILFFTDPNGGAGGARHVEFGMALALGKRLIVVGEEVENLFQRLPEVIMVSDWPEALQMLLRDALTR